MSNNRFSVPAMVDSFRREAKKLDKQRNLLEESLVDAVRRELEPQLTASLDTLQNCGYRLGKVRVLMSPSTYEGHTGRELPKLPPYINTVSIFIDLGLFVESMPATLEEYDRLHRYIATRKVSRIFDRFKKKYHLDEVHFCKDDSLFKVD